MFYQRNSVTGRLTPTPALKIPSNFRAAAEGPGIIYTHGTVFPKDQPARRGNYSTVPEALLGKMRHFQQHNNIPVHLKGGPIDKVLFGSTLVLCAVGLAGCFQFFYSMAFPKKN
ncbi:cytochrome c oxidase subunit 7A2, mitochondrial-like [Procambarus clarkii]|uniref:cytochrome c oxidase subunit 7A2, mitochondrial-like n=1 Tax=Procambarus clarkii TaxID=6728 RepID=UPI001E6709E4|nr:cytochrome c oxidase subunit 7A2, mitochondrial-like [Procambarus clarkii]